MSYKWTIPDVDAIELPMIHELLTQIGELPPNDILMNAQVKATIERSRRESESTLASLPRVKGKVRRRDDGG